MFLLKASNLADFPALADLVYEMFSEEEKNALGNNLRI
jgi:hypothetical protein